MRPAATWRQDIGPRRASWQPRAQRRKGGLQKIAFIALWLFIFTIPWENLIVLPGIGTAGRVAGIAAFGTGILAMLDSGRKPRLCASHAWMGLFVLWGGLTYFWSTAPDLSREELLTFLQLLGMVWLVAQFATEPPEQKGLMQAYVAGTYVASAGTLWSYMTGVVAHYNRFSVYGFNPGDLGLTLALSLPMSFYLSTEEKRPVLAWIYRLQVLCAIGAILLTAARGALIAMLVALLIIPLLISRWSAGQRLAMIVVACTGVTASLFIIPESSWQRLSTIGEEVSHGTLNQRTSIWKAGVDLFREQPIGGVGVGAYAPAVQRVLGTPVQPKETGGPADVVLLVAHNSFISVMVEQGTIGLAIFLALLFSLFLRVFRMSAAVRSLWLISLLSWSVGVMDLTWESRKPTWVIFGLIAAASLAPTLSASTTRRERLCITRVA
jgi:O-antigen ligase